MPDFENKAPEWHDVEFDENANAEKCGNHIDKPTIDIIKNILNGACGYLLVDTLGPPETRTIDHYVLNTGASVWLSEFTKYMPLLVEFFLNAKPGDMAEMKYLLGKYWKSEMPESLI